MFKNTSKSAFVEGWVTLRRNIRLKGYVYRQYLYSLYTRLVRLVMGMVLLQLCHVFKSTVHVIF